MTSYLGVHLNLISDQDAWFARVKPRIAKVLLPCDPDRLAALHVASPETVWIGRVMLDDQPMDDPGRQGRELGERLAQGYAPQYPDIDFYEGYNEINPTTPQDMARFAEHEIARTMALHRAGLKSAVGGFSMGTPELDLWPWFHAALDYADALHVHEYSFPSMRSDSSWYCGRFVRVYEALPSELRKPLVISECGIDGGAFQGWKRYTDAAGYMCDLAWYDQLLMQYASRFPILGATIFGWWGRTTVWDSFDIDGALAGLLCDYIMSTRRKPLTVWRRVLALLERLKRR